MIGRSVEPILAVPDVAAAVAYYEKVLGFYNGWLWGEPTNHGGVRLGDLSFQFTLDPELAERAKGSWFGVMVKGVDEFHDLHVNNGAEIVSPIENKPWNLREYTVRDLNGYRIRIGGQPVECSSSTELPEGVEFRVGVPTLEEFRVIQPNLDAEEVSARLARSHSGAVAYYQGVPVAMARAMWDAPGWFSVWDVEVVEHLRGRHIGFGTMETLLNALRAESPGAFVHLFTFKHGFYDKLGFTTMDSTMIRL